MTAPWTPRERALRAALEEWVKWFDAPIESGVSDSVSHMHRNITQARAALADPPPPDPRDVALKVAEIAIEECKTYITLYETDSDGPQACEAAIIHNDYRKCDAALAAIAAAKGEK